MEINYRKQPPSKTEEERIARAKAAQKRWRDKNPEKIRATMLKHRTQTNPTYRRREALKKYNMSIEDYNKIYEQQKGICLICKGNFPNGTNKGLVVDHCHTKGHVRGLLCNPCNQAIGMLKHDILILEEAIRYIQNGI